MGIPGMFRKITAQNPDIIFDVDSYDGHIDNFFVDSNSMMHPCAREVMKRFLGTDMTLQCLEIKICEEFLIYLTKVIQIVQPSNMLFIAIDGPAPRAKMNQQRSRRYKSSKMNSLSNEKYQSLGLEDHISKFDTNSITPGTRFMKRMTAAIETHFKKISREIRYKVILSSSQVAGEGEHKIMSHIRQNLNSLGRQINCIYGLDADLIFLSLTLNFKKMLLFREHVYFSNESKGKKPTLSSGGKGESGDDSDPSDNDAGVAGEKERFDYLSIDSLRQGISEDAFQRTRCRFDTDKVIRDYVFVCYLLGNDFLPHLPSLSIQSGGLESILKHYFGILRNSEKHLVLADENINTIFLKKLLQSLAAEEDRMLCEDVNRRKHLLWKPKFMADPNKTAKENEHDKFMFDQDVITQNDDNEIHYGEGGWRWRYWTKYFGCSPNDRPQEYDMIRRNVAREYFIGLKWTKYYYYNDLTDWRWYYPFETGPSLKDLVEYFIDLNAIQLPKNKPYKPLEQMMLVLPSSSQNLLPKTYASLMTQPNSPLLQYYPIDFNVHFARKRHFGETTPRLPVMDVDKVIIALKSCRLTASERECNILDRSHKFLVEDSV